MATTAEVKKFYDKYWPQNVPDYAKTEKHVLSLLPDRAFEYALDAGCGTGVCSLVLAKRAKGVVAFDLSSETLKVADSLARAAGAGNITVKQGDLSKIDFPDSTFDLVFSWGVVHHCVNPLKVIDELVRICKKKGVIIIGVYTKTGLTWFHEGLRKRICLPMPRPLRPAFIKIVAIFVRIMERLGKANQARRDNPRIESQVEDWFFVPVKHFFSISQMEKIFKERGLSFELICDHTARFKATNIFVVRGVKGNG